MVTANDLGGASSGLPLHPTAGNFEPDDTGSPTARTKPASSRPRKRLVLERAGRCISHIVDERFNGGVDPSLPPSRAHRRRSNTLTQQGKCRTHICGGIVDLLVWLLPRRPRACLQQREVFRREVARHKSRDALSDRQVRACPGSRSVSARARPWLDDHHWLSTSALAQGLQTAARTGIRLRARAGCSWRTSPPRTAASRRGSATTTSCTRVLGRERRQVSLLPTLDVRIFSVIGLDWPKAPASATASRSLG